MKKCYIETEDDLEFYINAIKSTKETPQIVAVTDNSNCREIGIIVILIDDTAYIWNQCAHPDMLVSPPWDFLYKTNYYSVTAKKLRHLSIPSTDISTELVTSPFSNIYEEHIHKLVDWAISLRVEHPVPRDEWFNLNYINALVYLERNGLYYNGKKIRVEYNPYTATTRASSKAYVDGETIFLPSLSKEKRSLITSRYKDAGMLINLDFDAFHLRLIADYFGFSFPYKSLHKYYAEKYFNTSNPTYEEYKLSKEKTFHTVYSDRLPEIDDPFLNAIIQLKKSITSTSPLITPMNRVVSEDEWPSKRFNYWIQMMEVEVSTKLIEYINIHADYPKTCLYIYDSILIDVCNDNVDSVIEAILQWNKINSHFPLTVSVGKDYGHLNRIN